MIESPGISGPSAQHDLLPARAPADFSLAAPLRWLQLDGEWIIFSAAAGALLQSDALTTAVCSLLEEGNGSAASLAGQVAQSMEVQVSDDLLSRIAEALDDLVNAGLVDCWRP